MKPFTWVSLMISSVTYAGPSVGEKAVYSWTEGRDSGTSTREVVESLGTGKFRVRHTSHLQDVTMTDDLTYSVKLRDSAQSQSNCDALLDQPNDRATLEIIELMGQQIPTCHISRPNTLEDWWYGDVPFATVKKEIRKDDINTRFTAELISFFIPEQHRKPNTE